jgi:hypothetical protein
MLNLILLAFTSCSFNKNKIEGVRLTKFYNDCQENGFDFGELITIGDPNDKFMISLPYDWDIQETFSDTLYGMIATNTLEAEENHNVFMFLSVTGYTTNDSLYQYFIKELKSLKKDKNMHLLESGDIEMDGNQSYWVKFGSTESENKFINLVLYVKSKLKNEIYLIHSCVTENEDADSRLCALKKLAVSFEFAD